MKLSKNYTKITPFLILVSKKALFQGFIFYLVELAGVEPASRNSPTYERLQFSLN